MLKAIRLHKLYTAIFVLVFATLGVFLLMGSHASTITINGASLAVCNPSPCTNGTTTNYTLNVTDESGATSPRVYDVYRPAGLTSSPSNRAPAIFVFGGAGACGLQPTGRMKNNLANTNRFIVVWLEVPCSRTGVGASNYIKKNVNSATPTIPSDEPAVSAIWNAVTQCPSSGAGANQCVDPLRVYAAGASSGGNMVADIMCDTNNSPLFRGYEIDSSGLQLYNQTAQDPVGTPNCPSTNKNYFVMLITGTVGVDGGGWNGTIPNPHLNNNPALPGPKFVDWAANKLGCTTQKVSDTLLTTNLRYSYFGPCAFAASGSRAVEVIAAVNGAHTWYCQDSDSGASPNACPSMPNPPGLDAAGRPKTNGLFVDQEFWNFVAQGTSSTTTPTPTPTPPPTTPPTSSGGTRLSSSFTVMVDDGSGDPHINNDPFPANDPPGVPNIMQSRVATVTAPPGSLAKSANPLPVLVTFAPYNATWDAVQPTAGFIKVNFALNPTIQYNDPTIASGLDVGVPNNDYCGPTKATRCDDMPWVQRVLSDLIACKQAIGTTCNVPNSNGTNTYDSVPAENIDATKIFVVGDSRGGTMTTNMLCDPRTSSLASAYIINSALLISPFPSSVHGQPGSQTQMPNCPALGLGGLNNTTGQYLGSRVAATNKSPSVLWVYGDNDGTFNGLASGGNTTWGVSNACTIPSPSKCLGLGYTDAKGRWHFGDNVLAQSLIGQQLGTYYSGVSTCTIPVPLTSPKSTADSAKMTVYNDTPISASNSQCSNSSKHVTAILEAGGPDSHHMPETNANNTLVYGDGGLNLGVTGWDFLTKYSGGTTTPTPTPPPVPTPPAADTTPPSVSLTAPFNNATVTGTINLSATASDNVGVANVQFQVDGANAGNADTSSPYSSSLNTAALTSGTHNITAVATDTSGNKASSSVSVSVNNVITVKPPTTPQGLHSTSVTGTSVSVAWTASSPGSNAFGGYYVVRNGVTLGNTSSTSYVDNSVSAGQTYSYQVIAYDALNQTSGLSSAISVTTPLPVVKDTTPPTVPTGLKASTVSTSQINLSWTASTDNVGVTGYTIYRDGNKLATVATTSYGDTALASGSSHKYYVTARDAAGNVSAESTTVTASTQAATPPTVNHEVGTVTGIVRSLGGKALVGVRVRIVYGGASHYFTTNTEGRYIATNVPVGSYTVYFSKDRFIEKSLVVSVHSKQTTTANISLSELKKV